MNDRASDVFFVLAFAVLVVCALWKTGETHGTAVLTTLR